MAGSPSERRNSVAPQLRAARVHNEAVDSFGGLVAFRALPQFVKQLGARGMDVADIRARLVEGRFEFSRHAFRRAVERNISEDEIRQAGSGIEVIEDYPDDKYSPSCLVGGVTERGRPLHMQVCYTAPEMLKIVTIYEPESGQWVDFRTRRRS